MTRRILGEHEPDAWAEYDAAVAATDVAVARLWVALGGGVQ